MDGCDIAIASRMASAEFCSVLENTGAARKMLLWATALGVDIEVFDSRLLHIIVIKQTILSLLAGLIRCCIIKLEMIMGECLGVRYPFPL